MFPGPSLRELTDSLAVGCRVSVWRGLTCLAADLPVWDAVLDATTKRNVQRQLSFTTSADYTPTHPLDTLGNFGQRVHAWQVLEKPDGTRSEVDLGWFRIETWEEDEEGGTVTVEAVDLLVLVEEDVAAWPSSPPKNQSLQAEVQRLVGSTLAIQYAGPKKTVDTTLQFQTDRLANLADLCLAYGLQYRMRPDGFLHVWGLDDRIVETYSAADLLLSSPRQSVERKPNRFLAVGSKTEGSGDKAKETKWSFEAKATAAPYDAAYGIKRERLEVQSATNQSMVTNAANQAMKAGVSTLGFRALSIVADPRLELGDTCMFIPADSSDKPFRARVVAFSLQVDRPAAMRVDVEITG